MRSHPIRLLLAGALSASAAPACGARDPLGAGSASGPGAGGGASCALAVETPSPCPTGAATLVSGRTPVSLQTDAEHVVYTTSPGGEAGPVSILEAAPLTGGKPSSLYTYGVETNEFAWTLRGGAVYLNDSQGHILRVPVDGGARTTLYTHPVPLRAGHFAADDTWLYFGERSNEAGTEKVYRLSLGGGTPEALAEIDFTWGYTDDYTPNEDVELAVDGCSIYWLHQPTIPWNGGSNGDGVVYRVSRDGGAPVQLAAGLVSPSTLTLTDDAVWVLDHAQSGLQMDDRFVGAGKDGSMRAPISFPADTVALFVLDTAAIDFVKWGPPDNLDAVTGWWTMPLSGGAATLIPSTPATKAQIFAATIDRRCRLLYSIAEPDIVRQPLP